MERGPQGSYLKITGTEPYRMFLPNPLPPRPAIRIDSSLLERATLAVGRLDGVATLLPDRSLFLYAYIRKEALLSSQIEGTQSSLSDLLLHESGAMPGVPIDDVTEVSRYVAAMDYGLDRLREGVPISLRLIREIHGVLLSAGRGSEKTPGRFRESPVWIGGLRPGTAEYVAPPHDAVIPAMGELETFIHSERREMPLLVKAALAHLQFETIHPFQDGNGRLGRLLITFLLCAEQALSEPLLYLSLYFKQNRTQYYGLLQRVRTHGVWEDWVDFFLEGVAQTAEQATDAIRRIQRLMEHDKAEIQNLPSSVGSVIRVHDVLRRRVLCTPTRAAADAGLTHPTATSALRQLEKMGIAREITGRARDRVYAYTNYLSILSEGTELPQR